MTPAKLRADAEVTAACAARIAQEADIYDKAMALIDEGGELGNVPGVPSHVAALSNTARAALALAELMPVLDALAVAKKTGSAVAVYRADEALLAAWTKAKESLK